MLTYQQATGILALDGQEWGQGYSGKGIAKNNGAMEEMPNVGPIPKGRWAIADWHNSPTKGPIVCHLTPEGHDAHGRTAFLIHGANREHPEDSSEGCIILPRNVRQRVQATHQTELAVI